MSKENYGLVIYTDRLRDGVEETIDLTLPALFLEVNETHLWFEDEIKVKGRAYIAHQELVVVLEIETFAMIPCSICNDPVKIKIHLSKTYLTIALEDVLHQKYEYGEALREALLLEVPHLVECHEGKCPQRKVLSHYFKTENKTAEEEEFHPFADL